MSGRLLPGRRWWLACGALVLLALAVRIPMFTHGTTDAQIYLVPWLEQVRAEGGIAAIGHPISNYTPPYLYLLALISYLPLDPLTAVKVLSTLIDLAMACVAGALAVHLRRSLAATSGASIGDPPSGLSPASTGLLVAAATALLPPVVLDSALLGQCDSFYTALLLAALLMTLKRRPWWALGLLGAALAVKLQAVFALPLFALFLIRGRLPWRAVPMVAAGWLLAMAPALVAGRPLRDLPGIYTGQISVFPDLTLNAPNPYQWLPAGARLTAAGMAVSALLIYGVLACLLASGAPITDGIAVRAGYLLLLLAPFTLPRMHERYAYPADVLGVLYAVAVRQGWIIALSGAAVSALCYLPFGLGWTWIPLRALAIAEGVVIVLVARELMNTAWRTRQQQPQHGPPLEEGAQQAGRPRSLPTPGGM